MNPWEKSKILGGLVSAILLPIVLLIVGNTFSNATKEREIQGTFVQLATEILREPPTEESRSLRQWATDVINEYSGVQLTEVARQELIESAQLPTPLSTNSASRFGVVFGGDSDLVSAEYEVNTAAPLIGIENAEVYLRSNSYRSVVIATTRAEAVDVLAKAKERRADAYIVTMNSWCPESVQHEEYIECMLP